MRLRVATNPINIATKYKTVNGNPSAIRVIGSPLGVMIAAMKKITTIAMRHCLIKVLGVRTPTNCKKTIKSGERKPTPNAKIIKITKLTYFVI